MKSPWTSISTLNEERECSPLSEGIIHDNRSD